MRNTHFAELLIQKASTTLEVIDPQERPKTIGQEHAVERYYFKSVLNGSVRAKLVCL
jgi:hypothetical protein